MMVPYYENSILLFLLISNVLFSPIVLVSSIQKSPSSSLPLAFLHPKHNSNNKQPNTNKSNKNNKKYNISNAESNKTSSSTSNNAIRNFHKNVRRMKNTLPFSSYSPLFWRNATISTTTNLSSNNNSTSSQEEQQQQRHKITATTSTTTTATINQLTTEQHRHHHQLSTILNTTTNTLDDETNILYSSDNSYMSHEHSDHDQGENIFSLTDDNDTTNTILLESTTRSNRDIYEELIDGNEEDNESSSTPSNKNKNNNKKQKITFYTYTHPVTNITYHASNTPKSKFLSYLSYILNNNTTQHQEQTTTSNTNNMMEMITETELSIHTTNETSTRNLLRTLWKQGRLLTNSTEILAFYASNHSTISTNNNNLPSSPSKQKKKNSNRRGSFLDYLYMYVDRFISILQDNPTSSVNNNCIVKNFLIKEYGAEKVMSLQKSNFYSLKTRQEQIAVLKPFLIWFRERFPYYYDRCDSCGISVKENPIVFQSKQSSNEIIESSASTVTSSSCNTIEHASNNNDDDNSSIQQQQQNNSPFLGYIYPSPTESKAGKASRTELYHCPYCSHYTRFPRYNAVSQILTMDKGRCGEYSMLLYQFLSSLGFEGKDIRWVVDWSDHVWVEILLKDGEYVHLDPCEAVVDHKLLYQEWGKKQTYIIAFSSPYNNDDDGDDCSNLIEDVTKQYTTDSWKDIQSRRDEDENIVNDAILDMQKYMIHKLNKI